MVKYKIIYLIGMMGSGKSTVAPLIAQQLGYDYTDTDLEVEINRGQSSYAIVDEIGVPGFRQLETQALAEVSVRNQIVVACGGGIVLREENWSYLRHNDVVVVWLNLPLFTIHKRIQNELRANLRGLNSQQLMTKLEEIFTQRQSLYTRLSDIIIEVNPEDSPQQVATQILSTIQS